MEVQTRICDFCKKDFIMKNKSGGFFNHRCLSKVNFGTSVMIKSKPVHETYDFKSLGLDVGKERYIE